jgi:hypothetical protein
MKKLITTTLIIFSLSASAQSSKDTTKTPPPVQDTAWYSKPLLSTRMVDEVMATKKANISVADWESFWRVYNTFLVPEVIGVYNRSKENKPQAKK